MSGFPKPTGLVRVATTGPNGFALQDAVLIAAGAFLTAVVHLAEAQKKS